MQLLYFLSNPTRRWPSYRTLCRWHFYAGLFCMPWVVWLSLTGTIYLFKPQVEGWLDQPYDQLQITGQPAPAHLQVKAALASVQGSVLNAYELPQNPHAAVRVLVGQQSKLYRVYVHPQTLQILSVQDEDRRLMRMVFRLHGELMLGDKGSRLVELAASWTIVMLLTGLYLWWPRQSRGLAGVLYPRWSMQNRLFWRDLHAVTGIWISLFALFLLLSGLPWAKSWGGMLKMVRTSVASVQIKQDWTTSHTQELRERQQQHASMSKSQHDEHAHHLLPHTLRIHSYWRR